MLMTFLSHLRTSFFTLFAVLVQSLIFSEKWEGQRGLGWAGLAPQNRRIRAVTVNVGLGRAEPPIVRLTTYQPSLGIPL